MPEDPVSPDEPEDPDEPVEPDVPAEPELPEDPEEPLDPEVPLDPLVPFLAKDKTTVSVEFTLKLPVVNAISTSSLMKPISSVALVITKFAKLVPLLAELFIIRVPLCQELIIS